MPQSGKGGKGEGRGLPGFNSPSKHMQESPGDGVRVKSSSNKYLMEE